MATRLCVKVGAQITQRVRGKSKDRMHVVLAQISVRFRIAPRLGAHSRSDARSNALGMQQAAGAQQKGHELRFDFASTGVNTPETMFFNFGIPEFRLLRSGLLAR